MQILKQKIDRILNCSVQGDPNYNIVIDRLTFIAALKYEESWKLLSVLLFWANSVCFYGMDSTSKQLLVRFIKERFQFCPNILSVGSKISDVKMTFDSDVGVFRESSKLNLQSFHFNGLADLKIKDLN